jgi:6-phosphogluconolactonase
MAIDTQLAPGATGGGRATGSRPHRAWTSLMLGLALAGCKVEIGGDPADPADPAADAAVDSPTDAAVDAIIPPDGTGARSVTAVWIGTGAYDPEADGRVDPYTLEGDTLTAGTSTAAGSLPSWIVVAPGGRTLYALDENNSRVRSFAVAARTGALTEIGDAASGGQGPVHMAIDQTGRWLLVAHYTSGTITVLPIGEDGAVTGAPSDVEATGTNTHQVVVDPSNRYVFVPCVGDNHVAQLVFDADDGTLEPNAPAAVVSEAGAGPRHLALHPDGSHAYVVNELGSTVTAYGYDASSGTLTRQASVATIPDDFQGDNTGAEIEIAADGAFLYSSNRGHDSIAVFRVGSDGALTAVERVPTGGTVPRSFALTPSGDRLIVANQTSNTVVSFAIDPAAGTLSSPRTLVETSSAPFFVGASALPAE